MQEIKTARRAYLLSYYYSRNVALDGYYPIWQSRQESQPGTALPATFPALATLQAAHYLTIEDLNGADENELVRNIANFSRRQARAVLDALVPLLPP